MEKYKYVILSVLLIFPILFVFCNKNRKILERKTAESEQIIQTIEEKPVENEDLEQNVIQSNNESQKWLSTREKTALPFIEAVKSGDRNKILKYLHFPMPRPFPIPYIENEQEMLEKFDMIFTDEILNDIINSSDLDWQSEAWRGIRFVKDYNTYRSVAPIWMDSDGMVFMIPVSNQEMQLIN